MAHNENAPSIARRSASVAVISLVLSAPCAHAITILDNSTGQFIDQSTLGWVLSPTGAFDTTLTAYGAGNRDMEIKLAASKFGSSENDRQDQAIYGAGVFLPANAGGYKVDFTVQAYAWDSYNVTVPAPGPTGYWDVFAVNANPSGYYWTQVLGDPITSPDPAGSVICGSGFAGGSCNPGSPTPNLPGTTWAWGALDYSNGGFESHAGAYSLALDGSVDVYLSFVLDTLSEPNSDQGFPSFGAFNPIEDVPAPVPVPAALPLLTAGLGMLGALRRRQRA